MISKREPERIKTLLPYHNTKYNVFGVHLGSAPLFLHKLEDVCFDTRMGAIRAFTSWNLLLRLKYKKMGFRLERISHEKRKLWFEGDCLEFSRFSDLLESDSVFDLLSFKLKLLNDKKRKGNCHYQSLFLLSHFGGELETSYVDDSLGKHRVLHSYIRDKEKKRIIDYTSNLVISEKDYESLLHPVVLNQITQEEFFSDKNSPLSSSPISLTFYCLFREELQNGHSFLGGEEWDVSSDSKQKRK